MTTQTDLDLALNDPIEPQSLQAVVRDKLTRAILDGRLQPGDRLVEREIASLLQVSKTPVREALQELARRGLVTFRAYRGMEVRTIEPRLVQQIYEVRAVLEPEALRLAMPLHDATTKAELASTLRESHVAGQAHDLVDLAVSNRLFHSLLYAPCPNELLRGMIDDVADQVALISVAGWRATFTWEEEAREHEAIFAAVEAGKVRDATKLLESHIRRSLKGLLRNYENATPSDDSQRR
ncbi:MAG: GntR family transcriptional regulator [Actinomycetota bacterium]